MSLRRSYHRHFGYHGRFHLAVAVTILAVAYVAVPAIVRFVESLAGYAPAYYEPKDVERGAWLLQQNATLLARLERHDFINIGLFLLVAVLWLTLVPGRSSRRRRLP